MDCLNSANNTIAIPYIIMCNITILNCKCWWRKFRLLILLLISKITTLSL